MGDALKPAMMRASGGFLYARLMQGMLGNRRGNPRLDIFGTVHVRGRGRGGEYTCACFDISARGIGVESPGPMSVGSFVTVYLGGCGPRRLARVRYCVRAPETFRVGLEFTGQPVTTR